MKATITSSRWGNLYRFRYFLDGARVSKEEFDHRTDGINLVEHGGTGMTFTEYGFRNDYLLPEENVQ